MKVALVQVGSVVMNKEKCLQKAIDFIEQAGKKGANLIVFPEAYIPAYPRGMGFGAVVGSRSASGRDDFLRYAQNAITIPGAETAKLGEAARQAGAYIVMGVIEREGSTLYCTVLFIDPNGNILGKHRKLKPTGSERLIWGEGEEKPPVFDTPYGKIGALICWENYMPLARYSLYEQGVEIYIAPTADARDSWFASMQHIAIEGRCFVLSCNQYVTKEMYEPDLLETVEMQQMPDEITRGGSCIVSPLGEFIVEPVFGKEEILFAELDLKEILRGKFDFDVVGHYARNNVLKKA